MVVRDLSVLRPGRAAYTLWCDDRGFVMEDGVVFRQSDNELLMTAARPMLSWLTSHEYGGRVAIEDVTDDYAMLAVQGPRSRDVLAGLVPEVDGLSYFGLAEAKLATVPVTVSRTGLHRRPRLRADRPGRRRASPSSTPSSRPAGPTGCARSARRR